MSVRPSVRHTFGFRIIIKVPIQGKFDYVVFHIYRSWVMAVFLLKNRDFLSFRMIFKVWLNQIFSNLYTMLWTIKYRSSSITVYFTFTVPEFLLDNRDFLGFRMIFKVPLNQIFSNFNTMLYTIKYRLSLIMMYCAFTVHMLWPFFS